jgi:hypothetical protein
MTSMSFIRSIPITSLLSCGLIFSWMVFHVEAKESNAFGRPLNLLGYGARSSQGLSQFTE